MLRGGVPRRPAGRATAPGRTCSRALAESRCLYVALGRGGNPQRIVASRSLQHVLRRLLAYLPRLGLLTETCQLLETIQEWRREHPVGPGGITEFDRMFEIGCRAIVRCLVISSAEVATARQSAAGHAGRRRTDRPAGADRRGPAPLLARSQPRRAALGAGVGQRPAAMAAR